MHTDDCPNFVPGRSYLGIAEFSRSSALANPLGGSARLAIRRRDMNVATKANNVIEPQRLEKAEKLRVAEAAIGKNGYRNAIREKLG